MRAFLSYIVSETLEGRADRIKSYSIAVEVFGRKNDFDASLDPIVRTSANRLRSALDRYNNVSANETGVRITLPKGRYVPVFTQLPTKTVHVSEVISAPRADVSVYAPPAKSRIPVSVRLLSALLAILLLITVSALVIYYAVLENKAVINAGGQPVLVVAPVTSYSELPAAAHMAQGLTELLVSHLKGYGNARIVDGRDGNDDKIVGAETNSDVFVLNAHVREANQQLSIVWQLDDFRSREVAWASEEFLAANATIDSTVDYLAGKVLGMEGAIPTIIGILYDGTTDQRGCLTKPQRLALIYHSVFQKDVMDCLEQTVEQQPNNAEAWAVLAQIYYRMGRRTASFGEDTSSFAAKLDHAATQSKMLAPQSLLAEQAAMYQMYNSKNLPAFTAIAHRILDQYRDPHLKIRIGNAFMNIGRVEEGLRLVESGIEQTKEEVGLAFLSLAYRAYFMGDCDSAIKFIERVGVSDYYLVPLIRTITYSRCGRLEEARAWLLKLHELRPNYESHLYFDFRHNNVSEDVIDSIAVGLRAAGATVEKPE
ncbi:tetratricopeptide repeat protein [Ochrobactrum sp. AN78]|uniref:tetratricopeptide repeat protein n=1 Tax=Ochrobactrum sp. AN78 TaxID=3039853 RepID=UPI002989AE7F|nr:tetratricopeptide repeat protein [Ochrobactrum sp. AN78]